MKLDDFFTQNPVFTRQEIEQALIKSGTANKSTINTLISYYCSKGKIVNIRRGIYAVADKTLSNNFHHIDPFILASKLKPDATLAYHTALEFYGKAYSVFNQFFYLSDAISVPFKFQEYSFRCISTPKSLKIKKQQNYEVLTSDRLSVPIKVTSLERTLVDVLDRPDLSGTWEEIWRSLESIEFFDIDKIINYTLILDNAATAAKVGFYLTQHRQSLMIEDKHFKPLLKLRPKQPRYIQIGKPKSGRLINDWNIVVPETIIKRQWMDVL